MSRSVLDELLHSLERKKWQGCDHSSPLLNYLIAEIMDVACGHSERCVDQSITQCCGFCTLINSLALFAVKNWVLELRLIVENHYQTLVKLWLMYLCFINALLVAIFEKTP